MRTANKKLNQLNIWPGFVDVLATLLIVTIFTIMISGIAQIYFKDISGKKTTEINELDVKLSEIAEKLSLQISKNKLLNDTNNILTTSLKNSQNKNKSLSSKNSKLTLDLKNKDLKIKIDSQKIFDLTDTNSSLLADIKNKNDSISSYKSELTLKITEIDDNLLLIKKLEQNITQLSKQISILSNQLNEAEENDKRNKVQIKNLGKKLNLALAGRVQELSEYQSIFLKKVKETIGERSDIIVSGDRFIFPSEIFFESASDELVIEANKRLKSIAISLIEISNIIPKEIDWVLRIDGHTDKRPISNNKFSSNWHLSSARAIKIVNFLISQGIPPNRLIAAGFGEFSPLLEDNTQTAYQKNRRIEIKLTNR